MKKNSGNFQKPLYLLLLCGISFFYSTKLCSQIMPDNSLYANGFTNYNNENWRYAIIYLFAYEQKNPEAFSVNPQLQKAVVKAFDHAMDQLAAQLKELRRLQSVVAKYQNDDGTNRQDGLHTKPPPLPNPSVVEKLKKQ